MVATSPAERSAIGNQSRSIGDHELVHACFMVSNAISCDSMSLRSKGSERILYILINRVDSHLVILTHIWRSETHQTVSYGLLLIRTCQSLNGYAFGSTSIPSSQLLSKYALSTQTTLHFVLSTSRYTRILSGYEPQRRVIPVPLALPAHHFPSPV